LTMKLHPLALFVVLAGSGRAFVPQSTPSKPTLTALKGQRNDWFGPAAVAVAGWAMVAQLSFAAPEDPVTMLPGESFFSWRMNM
jgi:hypothetical protein